MTSFKRIARRHGQLCCWRRWHFRERPAPKDVSGLVTARYRLNPHWSLGATGGVTRLLGDAADSPLNERRRQRTGFMSVAYTF